MVHSCLHGINPRFELVSTGHILRGEFAFDRSGRRGKNLSAYLVWPAYKRKLLRLHIFKEAHNLREKP